MLAGAFVKSINFGSGSDDELKAEAKSDIFVARLDEAGDHLWSTRMGGSGEDLLQAFLVSSQTQAMVAGRFGDELAFDGTSKTLAGGAAANGFVARISLEAEAEDRVDWAFPLRSAAEFELFGLTKNAKYALAVGGGTGDLTWGPEADEDADGTEIKCAATGQGMFVAKIMLDGPSTSGGCHDSSGAVTLPGGATVGVDGASTSRAPSAAPLLASWM